MDEIAIIESCIEIILKDENANITTSNEESIKFEIASSSTLESQQFVNEQKNDSIPSAKRELLLTEKTQAINHLLHAYDKGSSLNAEPSTVAEKGPTQNIEMEMNSDSSDEVPKFQANRINYTGRAETMAQECQSSDVAENKTLLCLQNEEKSTSQDIKVSELTLRNVNNTIDDDVNILNTKTLIIQCIMDRINESVVQLTQKDENWNILTSEMQGKVVNAIIRILLKFETQVDKDIINGISGDEMNWNLLTSDRKNDVANAIAGILLKFESKANLKIDNLISENEIITIVGHIAANYKECIESQMSAYKIENISQPPNMLQIIGQILAGIMLVAERKTGIAILSKNANALTSKIKMASEINNQIYTKIKKEFINHDLGENANDTRVRLSRLASNEGKEKNEKLSSCTISSSDLKISEDDFSPPDDDVCEKIIRQVEYCFSDFNIMKDSFLLKHVRRNKEGFVSLKLVASFRKVKSLTKDWRVVAHCVEKSKKLRLNEEKTKVCRIDPVPEYKDTPFAKTVVVFNLPFAIPTSEKVVDLFSKFGAIHSATIMQLGSELDNPFAKRCLAYHSEIASTWYAMIEFKEYDHSLKAIHDEHGHLAKENGLKVVPLLSQAYKNKTRNPKSQERKKRRGRDRFKDTAAAPAQKDSASSEEHLGIDQRKASSNGVGKLKTILPNNQQNGAKNGSARHYYYYRKYKQDLLPNLNASPKEHAYSNQADGVARNSWKQRRQLAGNNSIHSFIGPIVKARQPIGPDGSRGFYPGRLAVN